MDTVPVSGPLSDLARAHGVATDYWDWQGRHAPIARTSIVAILAALGVPAETDAEVAAALLEVEDRRWRRTLPATVVLREGVGTQVLVHVPHGSHVRLALDLEDGEHVVLEQVEHAAPARVVDGVELGEAAFALPASLPLGWHRMVAELDAPPLLRASTRATLVVTPSRLELPAGLDQQRAVGLASQLYQARSSASWGMGDLRDLVTMGVWAHDHGADFVLVNPLHAAEPVAPIEPSPYLPTTRRFLNPIYLRVEDLLETADLSPADASRVEALAEQGRALNAADVIDRDAVWALKREALGIVRGSGFAAPRGERAREYDDFCDQPGLTDYATWCALVEVYGVLESAWPAELGDPGSRAVRDFAEEHADLVDLHRWLQWQVSDQLSRAQRTLRDKGMRVGLVEDLAVGVNPVGADAWGLRDVLATGVSVGAPPDQFNQLGQDWSQPPWRPDRLAEAGYAPFRDMVRAALRDSGGLRIDHVIGLFRLWWIPQGLSSAQGAYVHYDHEALIGILVLEAHRAGAVVVGEDLGTVEPPARDFLLSRGIMGTSILWFEWQDGRLRQPEEYRTLCLSSVTTHDLPPTAGYLSLEHLAIRQRLGLLTRSFEEECDIERGSIATVVHALVERGMLAPQDSEDVDAQIVALHRWVAATSSRLVTAALGDLVGDRRAVNQPGTHNEYPNWRVPLSGPDGRLVTLDEIVAGKTGDLPPRVFAALRGE